MAGRIVDRVEFLDARDAPVVVDGAAGRQGLAVTACAIARSEEIRQGDGPGYELSHGDVALALPHEPGLCVGDRVVPVVAVAARDARGVRRVVELQLSRLKLRITLGEIGWLAQDCL